MKKRGFGVGRWNGVGGKINSNETIEAAMIRECQEEIKVTPLEFEQVAIHTFLYPDSPDVEAHVFVCRKWSGRPRETQEMAPQWFALDAIPYQEMWADDEFWLPLILEGKRLHASFTFNTNQQLTDQSIQVVKTIGSRE